jgi:hypothetical protein
MAIRLLNLGFSMSSSSFQNGNFEPYVAGSQGLACSGAWYLYTGSGLTLQDQPYFLTQALNPADWQFTSDDTTDLVIPPGDYVLVNIYPGDNTPPPNCTTRLTMVFGRGRDNSHNTAPQRQSPFQFHQGNMITARAVIDSDDSNAANWPGSPVGNNVWTYCLGMVHNHVARYSLSVGATIYNPASQTVGVYGEDPTLHVKGTGMEYVAA